MKAGKHVAYPKEWGTSVSKNEKPFCFVTFDTELGTITWRQFLTTEKGAEFAVKALVLMGFMDEDLKYLNETDALDPEKAVSITVEEEEYEGKATFNVKWVNPKTTIKKQTLEGVSLKTLFAETYKELGVETRKRAGGLTNAADCPF